MTKQSIAAPLIRWQKRHGRHDLPWQANRTPYRVWLSEVMLQQTQVQTVIDYFNRFTARFPEVGSLATADLDDVLHLWTGLGYYSRARNLHAAARAVVNEHDGQFPQDQEALMALPGIGRSTAAAIIALAFEQPAAILDGNVKRVLARLHAEPGWPGTSAVLKRLWDHAEHHLPSTDARAYTQALMDLGATVCTRRSPRCDQCPLAAGCAARAAGEQTNYPAPRPRRKLPERHTHFLIAEDAAGRVLLERRPAQGIWGGLWSFPEYAAVQDLQACLHARELEARSVAESLAEVRHSFTHFRLRITPVKVSVATRGGAVRETDDQLWYSADDSTRIGISTPVARLLKTLRHG